MTDPDSGGAGGRRAAAPGGVLPYVPAPALRVAAAAAPLLAFVPVLYYSLATPFALIDDYHDWRYVEIFDGPDAFLQWCRRNFLEPGILRYRPFWEFHNAVAWKVFGPEPWLHHLSRWVFHFGAVLLFAAAFLRFSGREADETVPAVSAAGGVRPLLPLALLVHLWIFFPNVPAARLGPQEVHSVFFLGLCNYAFALMLAAGAARNPPAGRSTRLAYGLFLAAGLGLSLSKEANVAPLLWMSIAYWGLLAAEPASWSSRAVRGAPLALVFFFTLHRVHAASSLHPYDFDFTPGAGQFADNLGLILRELFLLDTSFVLAGGFVLLSAALLLAVAARLAAFGRLSRTARGELLFVLFLLGQFFSTYFLLAGLPHVAPRYWYVLVPCFTTLLAFGARYALAFLAPCPRRCLAAARALAAFVLFFILVNYHNFLFQTTVQHSLRRTEADLIATVNRLLDGGQRVQILKKESPAIPGVEMVDLLELYYRGFQPRFHGRKYLKTYAGADPLHADSPRLESDQPRWVVSLYGDAGLGPGPMSRSGGFRGVDLYGDSRFVNAAGMVTMVPRSEYRLLSWAGTVSRFLQRGGPRVVLDFGVHTPDDRQLYGWVVWHAPYDPGDWMAGTLSRIVARAGEPVVRSHWDVHVEESARLAYLVKDACAPADTEADFFVEILETDEAERGFHRIAFSFGYWGVAAGGRCVVAVAFPNGVEGMTVGQYGVWSEVVAFRRAPAAARLTAP